jgi:hypothetical protein
MHMTMNTMNPPDSLQIDSLQIRDDEEIFLQALKSHRASVRFSMAGLFVDAIHSILEGFETLEVLLKQYGVTLNQVDPIADVWFHTFVNEDESIQVDEHPLDGNFEDREETGRSRSSSGCPCPYHYDLLLAMIYNLGLAYHLYALKQQHRESYLAALHQSFNLYMQAKRLSATHDAPILIRRSLENNLCHAHIMLHTKEIDRKPTIISETNPSPQLDRITTVTA